MPRARSPSSTSRCQGGRRATRRRRQAGLEIDAVTAKRLNADSKLGQQLGAQSDELSRPRRPRSSTARRCSCAAPSLRLTGDLAGRDRRPAPRRRAARAPCAAARSLRSCGCARRSSATSRAIAEDQKNAAEAERLYRQGVALLEGNYPGSAALLNAKARLAGYLARSGQARDRPKAMFREIVHSQPDTSNLAAELRPVLRPYVDLLLKKGDDPAATRGDLRRDPADGPPGPRPDPGGACARADRRHRRGVAPVPPVGHADPPGRARADRARAARGSGQADAAGCRPARASFGRRSSQTQKEQLATQAALGSFPRYRAVSSDVIALADLQKMLRPGEAYYRMTIVGDHVYAMLVTPTGAARGQARRHRQAARRAGRCAARHHLDGRERPAHHLSVRRRACRTSSTASCSGRSPRELAAVKHLIFEPDGAMLRLPPNLLVMDQASVDAYSSARARAATPTSISAACAGSAATATSARRSARAPSPQLRSAPPSAGPQGLSRPRREHAAVGVGRGADPGRRRPRLHPAAVVLGPPDLRQGAAGRQQSSFASFDPNGVQIVTGDEFTDTALEARSDLDHYRIIHFATHGVVTARAPKCAAQPALLTSFGGNGSDGLLTFREIFDLQLDADLVILSACDTAGKASAAATQQAGLATGGDVALDGLVRAFVGAGGRLVIASHWPVPDDYNATQRLITGLFSAPPGTPTVTALRMSQRQLMDDANTSHPFYWSAFAAVGDGEIPVIRAKQQIAQRK